MINVGDLSAFVTEWRGKNREWSKIISEHYMNRRDRADFSIRKIAIDLLHFCDVYDVYI